MNHPHETPRLPPGKRLDDLTIRAPIGRGRTAEVYQAYHMTLKREVAVRVFSLPHRPDPALLEQFEQQTAPLKTLRHPNIIRTFETGAYGQSLFVVTELVKGPTLRDVLSTRPTGLDREWAERLFSQIASAIGTAHDQGITHGNLKPENILLDERRRPVVTDFLIPCIQAQRNTMGQPSGPGGATYLAPEQHDTDRGSQYADIYALGVVLYEMITGKVPFSGETFDEVMRHHRETEPVPPSQINTELDPRFDHVILTALDKAPTARFGSARDMLAALDSEDFHSQFDTLTLTRDTLHRPPRRQSEIMRFEQSRVEGPVTPGSAQVGETTSNTTTHRFLYFVVSAVIVAIVVALILLTS